MSGGERARVDIAALFAERRSAGGYLNVQAPMVRYSKVRRSRLCLSHSSSFSLSFFYSLAPLLYCCFALEPMVAEAVSAF